MKCNITEVAHLSDQPCDIEGRLNYKKVSQSGYLQQGVFKERWFRLVKNYLFYFKITEMGKFDTKQPAGVFVMENSSVQMEHGQNISFAFSISFIDEVERRHLFTARSEDNVTQWVTKLRVCSYEYLRNQLHTLQSKIFSITGNDPLLMVPRNEGAKLWAPAVPYSTTPACNTNSSTFSCHLHTNGAFTLERSKSDANAHEHLKPENNHTRFYVKSSTPDKIALGRSNTSIYGGDKSKFFDNSIFDNRPQYSRAAPSPPVRKKTPTNKCADTNDIVNTMTTNSLERIGHLDSAPIPPRRKLSPNNEKKNNDSNEDKDLITF